MIVSRALTRIGEDAVGAYDLPEFKSCVGIAGMKIGMGSLHGTTERYSQLFGVVARKGSEQIVQRIHRRTHGYSTNTLHRIFRREFVVENRALIVWTVAVDGGKKMTELCTLTISPPDCRVVGAGVNDWPPQSRNGWRPAAGRTGPGPASRRPDNTAAHIRSSSWPRDRGRRSSGRPAGIRNPEGTAAPEARPRAGKAVLLHALAGWSRQGRAPEGWLGCTLPAQKRGRSARHRVRRGRTCPDLSGIA